MKIGYWIHTATHSDLYIHVMAVYPCSDGYKCKIRYLNKRSNNIQYIGKPGEQFEYVVIKTEDVRWWKHK